LLLGLRDHVGQAGRLTVKPSVSCLT
jgi:hypothetical protein